MPANLSPAQEKRLIGLEVKTRKLHEDVMRMSTEAGKRPEWMEQGKENGEDEGGVIIMENDVDMEE